MEWVVEWFEGRAQGTDPVVGRRGIQCGDGVHRPEPDGDRGIGVARWKHTSLPLSANDPGGLPVSGHTPDPELHAWLALRRVYRGGVAKVGGGYVDRGRPVPGYVANALDGLVRQSLLKLAEMDLAAQQRVTLTHAGQTRYLELGKRLETGGDTEMRAPSGTASATRRWALSPLDHHCHVLEDGVFIAQCGQFIPSTVTTSPAPGGAVCPRCAAIVIGQLPGPLESDTRHPDSGV